MISCISNNEFYIGSTNNFTRRKSSHKKCVTNKSGKKYWCILYQYIRANGGWINFNIEIILEDEYESLIDVRIKEQELIDLYDPSLNSIRANKSRKLEILP
jgi:hypothetical protein